jgi:hypothetical protein
MAASPCAEVDPYDGSSYPFDGVSMPGKGSYIFCALHIYCALSFLCAFSASNVRYVRIRRQTQEDQEWTFTYEEDKNSITKISLTPSS